MDGRGRFITILRTATLGALAFVVAAGPASANDYCVVRVGCAADATFDTPQAAADAAAGHAGADRVLIGAGTFGGLSYAPGDGATNPVEIRGAGRSQTTLQSGSVPVYLGGTGSKVADITIDGPEFYALDSGGPSQIAEDVTIRSVNIGIVPEPGSGLTLRRSSVSAAGYGYYAGGRTVPLTVEDSTFTGSAGAAIQSDGPTHLTRIRIDAQNYGYSQILHSQDSSIVDSLVTVHTGAAGITASAPNGTGGVLTARNVTVVGTPGGYGVLVGDPGGAAPQLELSNSIVVDGAIRAAGAGAYLHADHSNYPSGDATDGGAFVQSARVTGPPGVASAANPHLRGDSALIDGGADVALPPGATDLDGNPRTADGRGDGGAQIDLGAFEYQRGTPVASATAPATAVMGQPVPYDASASHDPDPGDSLVFTWTFDDGGTASGPTPTHTWTTLGRHTATVTVTDPAGLRAATTVDVTAVPPPDTVAPAFASASITPAFRVGSGATSLTGQAARTPVGATIRYRLSEAATVRLAFSRVRRGVRRGGRCVAPPRHPARMRRCTRYVAEGTLTRTSHAGANRVRFTGRIGRRGLAVGRHRLHLRATDRAGNRSRLRTLFFRVRA
ncbi:MAG: hypothetical protein QOE65_974 [Solirubrobacteraceae bacterium]|nr:hypothetical protein [Solirubrobacteraceae bacterium]